MNSFIHKNKNFFLGLKRLVNSVTGFDIIKYPSPDLDRRLKLIRHHNIDAIIDVGANVGQFGGYMRSLGFKGRIISFEPMKSAFAKLERYSKNDPLWEVHNCSLGERDGHATINISENSVSSSLLNNLPVLTDNAPQAKFVKTEDIQIKKLDTVFGSLNLEGKNIYVKIDTQGYEDKVLQGAEDSLQYIAGMQIEMSLIPSYEGSSDFKALSSTLENKGFKLTAIENGFYDKETGYQLEIDGIFFRR